MIMIINDINQSNPWNSKSDSETLFEEKIGGKLDHGHAKAHETHSAIVKKANKTVHALVLLCGSSIEGLFRVDSSAYPFGLF